MQLRVDALGGVTKWKYNESSANWKETYFKSRAAVALHGCEENEDGTIASDDAQGFAVEIFIPWSEFSSTPKRAWRSIPRTCAPPTTKI